MIFYSIYGGMELVGEWSDIMIDNINMILDEWCNLYDYDIDGYFEGKTGDGISFVLALDYHYSEWLEWDCIFKSDNYNTIKAYKELCREMSKCIDDNNLPTAWIDINFKEYKDNILCIGEAELKLFNGEVKAFIKEEKEYICPIDIVEGFFHSCKIDDKDLEELENINSVEIDNRGIYLTGITTMENMMDIAYNENNPINKDVYYREFREKPFSCFEIPSVDRTICIYYHKEENYSVMTNIRDDYFGIRKGDGSAIKINGKVIL